MLLIPCVYCGLRAEPEFTFGGEAASVRPRHPDLLDDSQWAEYLYMRENPKGRNRELWVHSGGCGQWFVLERDTATHGIGRSYLPNEAPVD